MASTARTTPADSILIGIAPAVGGHTRSTRAPGVSLMFSFSRWLRSTTRNTQHHARGSGARRKPQTVLQVERLEARELLTVWNPIGPLPIANGQTAGNLPVSGRVTGV